MRQAYVLLTSFFKEEIQTRFNLISEERVTIFEQNTAKPDENWLKNKEVMTF